MGTGNHFQAWWDCGPASVVRTFAGEIPNQCKQKRSPFRSIPGLDDPGCIQPDLMHTFNLGFGKDLASSAIFLLCRHNVFSGSSNAAKLKDAFAEFQAWCTVHGKTSYMKTFELKTFKVTSSPSQ